MRDPFAWSIPFGRLFGVAIRIHILFPFVALAMILRAAVDKEAVSGQWIDMSLVLFCLFFSVLLHEFGHCFGARWVDGDADKVLLWPLGGLASVEVPHTPKANFITTIMGPMVNLVLAMLAGILLWALFNLQPTWNPLFYTGRGLDGLTLLHHWGGAASRYSPTSAPVILTHFFWVNYFLFLLNMLLIGFPMDGGRIFQCIAWKYVGYHRGTLAAVYAGYVTMLIVGLAAIVSNEVLMLCLALFIYFSCNQQYMQLEMGREDTLFGYDFSQGYTSLEREDEEPGPREPRKGWWQRWKERREKRKQEKEEAQRKAEEERLDELLDKIQREGRDSLTEEEQRFMTRVSHRYKNRQ